MPKDKGTIISFNRQAKDVITTKGWDVKTKCTDQSTSWLPLAVVKESNHVELAEFVYTTGYESEPAFKWWFKKALRHGDRFFSCLKTIQYRKGRMKFRVQIPGTVEEALCLDKDDGNDLWKQAIEKEWKNFCISCNLLDCGESAPIGYKEITCHLIFDLKLDMTRKACYVAGRHLTDVPSHMTYSRVFFSSIKLLRFISW